MPKFTIKYNIALSHENNDELEIAESEYENLITEVSSITKQC